MALGKDPALGELRADCARNVAEVGRILARYASWADRTARPGRDLVCRLAGISVSTWKACRRWLEAHGYLGLVSAGRSAPYVTAPMGTSSCERGDAAVYVLCVRRRPMTRQVSVPPRLTRPPTSSRRERVLTPREGWCGGALRALRYGPAKTLSEAYLAWIARPFLAAPGWKPSDLRYAVDHRPDQGEHAYVLRNVRHPAAWLRWRLGWWLGPDGRPVASHSQQLAARAAWLRQTQAEFRAGQAAAAAQRADPAQPAAEIRAALGWVRPLSRGSPESRLKETRPQAQPKEIAHVEIPDHRQGRPDPVRER